MANAPLPNVQGTTLDKNDIKEIFVNQLAGITKLLEVSEKNLEVSKDSLDIIKKGNKDTKILEDIRSLLSTISHNILTGLVATLEPAAMDLLESSGGGKTRLEAKEAANEAAKLKGEKGEEKEERGKAAEGILSFFKNLFTVLLIPLIVGFWIGLTKKFNILTIALSVLTAFLVRHPIKTLKFLWDSLKFLRTSLAKFVDGFKNLFSNSKILQIIRNKFLDTMLSIFMKVESIFQGEKISKIVSYVKGIFSKANGMVTKIIGYVDPVVDFVKGMFSKTKGIVTKFFKFIDPVVDFFKTLFEPLKTLFSAGSKMKGLMSNKALGWLLRIGSKGLKAIPVIGWIITAAEGLYGAVTGGMEGFEEGGIKGMIRGALVGLVDGLVGWIVDIGKWITSSLLDLFGFEDAAKIVEGFDFKKFVDKYAAFIFPIVGLMDMFDENSELRKQIQSGIDAMKNFDPSDFFVNLGEVLMEMIKRIAEAMPGGKSLLKFLGIETETEEKDAEALDQEKRTSAADRLRKAGVEDAAEAVEDADDVEEAKSILMEKYGFPEEKANEILGITQATPTPAPTPAPAPTSPQLAGSKELQAQTDKYKDLAAAPPKPKPVAPMTNVAIDASQKQSVNYHRELHAQKQRGGPGVNYRSVV